MATDDPVVRRPSLARELFWNLGLLTVAALSLAVATALFVQSVAPRLALAALLGLIAGDILILYVFGRHLVHRLVLQPVTALTRAADAIAQGDLETRVPPTDTAELQRLGERINEMTSALQDVQHQLVRAEKLAGIGRLAAGIAHEVGNPLGAIANYAALLRRRGVDPEVLEDLDREVGRIDAIVRGLLAYARPGGNDDAAGPVDVGGVAGRVLDLLRRQGTLRGCEVRMDVATDLPPVRGRAQGLDQVFVNLLLNAVDAAPGGPIGLLVMAGRHDPGVPTRVRSTDGDARVPGRRPSRVPQRPELAPGTPGVLIVVSDAGPGVPASERERVFDPFVTTKAPGAGTGLGLAVVQRIVHEAGGLVWVDDAREGGAAFKVFLPATGRASGTPAADPSIGRSLEPSIARPS
jgi:signal transduction histidine kinase